MEEIRRPAVAGQFYNGTKQGCLAEVKQCLPEGLLAVDLPGSIVAGIVPHAGWVFSGELAGLAFSAIKQSNADVDTFVIFGAAHRYLGIKAAVYGRGRWETPLGEIFIDEDLAGEIIRSDSAEEDIESHRLEHSLEVQVPFIQHLFPKARIVPVMVGPSETALKLGEEVASAISKSDKKIVCIASTDLTHYGPRYGFCPAGSGAVGLKWAKEVNDVEFINAALKLDARKAMMTAVENSSACGPGAAAAAITVATKLGKTQGLLLGHTDSNEVMQSKFGQSSQESVGYAAIVY